MKRLAVSPLIERALGVAQRHLGAEELGRRLQAPPELILEGFDAHLRKPADIALLKAILDQFGANA